MFINNILTFLRDIKNNKLFNFINIFGLSIGFACSIVLLAIILHFLSFDKFHNNSNYIYQAFSKHTDAGNSFYSVSNSYMVGKTLLNDIPEIKNTASVSFPNEWLLISGNKKFKRSGRYADPSIFSIFTIPILGKLSSNAFNGINSISISESLAKKYFGSPAAALGRILLRHDSNSDIELSISSVFQDMPGNSVLNFNFLMPMDLYIKNNPAITSWGDREFVTYIQVHKNVNIDELNKKLRGFIQLQNKYDKDELTLSKFDELLLNFPGSHDIGYIVIFVLTLIGAGILIIASVNFINLSTSRASKRAKEVSIRKVVGANRSSLIIKFFSESIFTAILAAILSLCLAEGMLPLINNSFGGYVHFQIPFNNYFFLSSLILIVLLVGLGAGVFTAFFLFSFSPVLIKNGSIPGLGKKYLSKKYLLVFQFVISTIMIFSSLVIYRQISYIKNKDLGININHIIKFEISKNIKEKLEPFKNEMNSLTCIKSFTFSDDNPVEMMISSSSPKWDGKPEGMNNFINLCRVSDKFLYTFNIKLIEGKDIDDLSSQGKNNFLINEKMVELMGKENPIGERLSFNGMNGHILGVVKDFNMGNLMQGIMPVVIYKNNENLNYCFVRTRDGELPKTISVLKDLYGKYEKVAPFTYTFLDEDFVKSHFFVDIAGNLVNIFAVVSILISCLGLFGLTAFIIEQRRKEIGIRKVLGASVISILSMVSKNFVYLVIIANIIALPIGYFLMSNFLKIFAYRTEIGPWLIFSVVGFEIILALITINYHSIKISISNPVECIKK